MKSKIQIQERLDFVRQLFNELDPINAMINTARIDTLNWVLCLFDVNTEKDLLNKITRIKEEMIPLINTDITYKEKQARITELNFCLDNPTLPL